MAGILMIGNSNKYTYLWLASNNETSNPPPLPVNQPHTLLSSAQQTVLETAT